MNDEAIDSILLKLGDITIVYNLDHKLLNNEYLYQVNNLYQVNFLEETNLQTIFNNPYITFKIIEHENNIDIILFYKYQYYTTLEKFTSNDILIL
jgi:hypothetical protein